MIERFLARQVELGHFPGATYAIVDARSVLRAGQVGSLGTQTDRDREPLVAETIYDVASLTKPLITATIAMRLMERGSLDLASPVRELLPEARWEEHITVEQLLLHTSGLPAWRPLFEAQDPFEALLATPLERSPGGLAVYSCLGFILLGRILERVGGASLRELGQALVLAPLGVSHSWFSGAPALQDACHPGASGPRVAPTEARVPLGVVHDDNARALGGMPGNAGLFSTAEDLGLYAMDFLRALRGESALLAPATARAMIQARAEGADEARSWGWMVQGRFSTSAGGRLGPAAFGHTGFTGTSLFFDPDRARAYVLLTNRVHPTLRKTPMFEIRRGFHDWCHEIDSLE